MLRFILCSLLVVGFSVSAMAQTITVHSGGTVRVLNEATLLVGHDFTVAGTFDADAGTLAFTGDGPQRFTPAKGQTVSTLVVDKSKGDVMLQGDLAVGTRLLLTSGDLDLNGFTIDLGKTGVLAETAGNTVKGSSGSIAAERALKAPTNENIAGLGVEVTSAADLGNTRVTRGHTAQQINGTKSILRFFDISPTNNSGLNATLIFAYDASELNNNTEANLKLFRSIDEGRTWTQEGGTGNTAERTVTLDAVDVFSRWTLVGEQ